jgi:transcriptional regulator with XRE-family HTH domain
VKPEGRKPESFYVRDTCTDTALVTRQLIRSGCRNERVLIVEHSYMFWYTICMKRFHIIKEEAVRLRKAGYSYTHISSETGVSKSTLSDWLGGVPYEPNKETVDKIGKARAASGFAKNRLKLDSIAQAQKEAKKDIGKLDKRDLFMAGLGLYIGEGSKSHNIVRITNSNYQIILFAIRWFNEVVGVPTKNFSLRIHMYPDSDEKEVLKFWATVTGFSTGQFRKSQVDYREGKKSSKKGQLPYGTAHLSVRSCGQKELGVFLSRKIEAWTNELFNNKRV